MFGTGSMLGGATDKFKHVSATVGGLFSQPRQLLSAARTAMADARAAAAAAYRAPRVQVMSDKQNKQMLTFIGGFAVVLLLLYFLFIK